MIDPNAALEVDDVETFEILSNPTRLRILRNLKTPASVKELAERLGVPPTRLYYHVNLLVEAGVITVAETRKVGAMLEKRYQRTAHSFTASPRLVTGGHDPVDIARIGAGVVLDGARVDAEAALAAELRSAAAGDSGAFGRTGRMVRSIAHLTAEGAAEIQSMLDAVLQRLEELDVEDDGSEFGMTVVFFPVAGVEEQK